MNEEADYRRALREAEPPLLKALRKHRNEVLRLQQRAHAALGERRGRTQAFSDIESALRTLNSLMFEDIAKAASEQANKEGPRPPAGQF